jgi:hypothetical protein
MNFFDRDALARTETRSEIVLIRQWTQFRVALKDLVDSYNRNPKGKLFPATLKAENENKYFVECPQGKKSGDPLTIVMVTAWAAAAPEVYTIQCAVEKWTKNPAGRERERFEEFPFELEREGDSLMYKGKHYTAEDAATRLLVAALMPEKLQELE